jgi:hypothetical protein
MPDPNNPGWLTDGTPDPAYGASGATSTLPGPPDYGMGPAPTVAPALVSGSDFSPDPGCTNDYAIYRRLALPALFRFPSVR